MKNDDGFQAFLDIAKKNSVQDVFFMRNRTFEEVKNNLEISKTRELEKSYIAKS